MEGDSILSVLLPLALFVIMFGMGMSLHKRDFCLLIEVPGVAAAGIAINYLPESEFQGNFARVPE